MLKKLKVKSISYNFILAPCTILLIYIITEYISLNIIFGDYYPQYRRLQLLFVVFFLAFLMFITERIFGKKSEFIKDLISNTIVLYFSFILVGIFYYVQLNFGNIHYCAENYNKSAVGNIYTISIVLTFLTSFILFYLITQLKIKFEFSKFSFLLILFCIFQFLATKGFRHF